MASDNFRDEIRQELEKLNREQVVKFAWLCAVRALPFLGAEGNFKFWNKKDRQIHLYSIFYAIDIAASAYDAANDYAYVTTAAYAASATATASSAAAATYAASSAASAASAANKTSAAYDAYDAAYAAASSASAYDAANDYVYDAASAAASTASAANRYNKDLKNLIIQDLNSININGGGGNKNPLEVYGKIWDNFQNALEDEDCVYWGKLYQNIFNKGFELDKEALKRRMSIPKEIRMRGAATVANYLEKLEKGATRLNEARIIILGDKGSGKTCIARRLKDPTADMTTPDESTAGVDTTIWELEKDNINVRIWDFAGHVVTHAVHQFFLSERCLYLIVYDGRTEERNRLEYWLDHMKNYGGNSEAIILVNERDQHRVDIPINTLDDKYSIAGVYYFSIKEHKKKLEKFRNDVADYIKNNPSWEKQLIPESYYKVKEELEKLFNKNDKKNGREHISKEEFDKIAKVNDIDNVDELLKDLHNLGVSLWYDKMKEYNTLILNPEWISQGVYKIINWVNEEKKYNISLDDFAKVFSNDLQRYPLKKHEFLFDLMKHYELAYQTREEKCLIIPHLLNKDRPSELPDFQVGESLMLRYKAEQPLPPDTISRFIVRHNQEIKNENSDYKVWRYGVILEDEKGSTAMVREDDRTISVSVKGRDKTNYISALRETLNDIFKSYKSEKPELQYRIEHLTSKAGKEPIWLSEEVIINHNQAKISKFYESYSNQYIPIQLIIESLNINLGSGTMNIVGRDFDNSTHNTFNFYDCNIALQSNLNGLAQLLTEKGKKEEANDLENVAKALEQAEQLKTKEEVKKKGVLNRLKYLAADLGDENSKLYKTVKGIKYGVSIAHDIVKAINNIAKWAT